jgi:hypothetical protein
MSTFELQNAQEDIWFSVSVDNEGLERNHNIDIQHVKRNCPSLGQIEGTFCGRYQT